MASAGLGNLMLIDEDGEDMRNKAPIQPKIVVFKGEDAGMIMHFFKIEFEHISLMSGVKITREPKLGDLEELTFEFDEADTKVNDLISALGKALLVLDKDVVHDIPRDKAKKVKDFIQNNTTPDILMIRESDQVTVIGKNYEKVKQTVHKLKVEIGHIQINNRRHRGKADSDTSTTSSQGFDGSRSLSGSSQSSSRQFDGSRSFSGSPSSSRRFDCTSSLSGSNSGDNGFNYTAEIDDCFTLKIYKENITRVEVAAIVNAANESLMHGGGVARVISEAAGYELDQESKDYIDKNGPLEPGKNVITTAGRLKNRFHGVIHAVGPVWHGYREKVQCLKVLYDCIWNILKTCNDENYRTVAMSAISSGIFGVPKELCADMYVAAVADYAAKKSKGKFRYPEELHIIDIDVKILQLVQTSFEKWKRDPDSVSPEESFEQYKRDNPYYHDGYTNTRGTRSDSSRGQRSRGHGQNASASGISKIIVKHDVDDKCTFIKLSNETFRWGGEAQVYLVGKHTTVKIFKGEINKTNSRMKAIVCGIDISLQGSGYIAESLKKAGGAEYRSNFEKMVSSRRTSAKVLDVYQCGGGKLGVGHVMFIVSDRITYADNAEIQTYQETVLKVLEKASDWNYRNIVIPMFGTGQIQTSRENLTKCAKALLKALDIFVSTRTKNVLQEIHLANNNELVNGVLCDVFDDFASKRNVRNHGNQLKHGRNRESSGSRDNGKDDCLMGESYTECNDGSSYQTLESNDTSFYKTRHTNNSEEDKAGGMKAGRSHGNSSKFQSTLNQSDGDREDKSRLGSRQDDDRDPSDTSEKPKQKGNLAIFEV